MARLYDYVLQVLDLNDKFIKENSDEQTILGEKLSEGLTDENRDEVTLRLFELDRRVEFTQRILDVVKEFTFDPGHV